MKMEEFTAKLGKTKHSSKYTGFSKNKVQTNHEHTRYIISSFEKCKSCQGEDLRSLTVEFSKHHQMTIFEADMLFMVFIENKRPADYANFHKCPAGIEFIENIKSIKMDGEKSG